MMSPEQVVRLSNEAARRAKRARRQPQLIEQKHLDYDTVLRSVLVSMPNLGTYRPEGWNLVNASELLDDTHACVPWHDDDGEREHYIQVDKSGFGAPGEPALTFDEFVEAVKKIGPDHGYGIVEEGQFQVVIGVFRRVQ